MQMGGVPSPSRLAQTFVVRVSAVARVLEREHKQSSVGNLWTEDATLIVFFGTVRCVVDTMWERSRHQDSWKSPVREAGCFPSVEQSEELGVSGDTLHSPRVETQEAFIQHKCKRG